MPVIVDWDAHVSDKNPFKKAQKVITVKVRTMVAYGARGGVVAGTGVCDLGGASGWLARSCFLS